MTARRIATVVVVSLAVAAASSPAASAPPDALALCSAADRAPAREQRALLEQGLAAAEAAVAADERDASAHFAVFCNLGKRMRLDGVSFSNLIALRRLRREIDRTLELAPDHADALVGKAALLYYTPRLLGGDPVESERLLRSALVVAPDYVDARVALARMLEARGARDEARTVARRALDDAERLAKSSVQSEARSLLDRLADGPAAQ